MQVHGYLKPVVVGEHAGPQPFEFPDAMAVMQETFAAAFAEAAGTAPSQSTGELAERAKQDSPERRAMTALYDRIDSLPPRLQMFMAGCPAELAAKRDRINARQVVMRTILALAEGVHRTAYWNLAPEYPGPVDHLQMMHLLIGKLPLLGYRDGDLAVRHPRRTASPCWPRRWPALGQYPASPPATSPACTPSRSTAPAAVRCSSSGITVTPSTARTNRPPR